MKKLLGILVLGLLWCNAVLALDFPGLKNTKRFHILVNDVSELGQQKCKIKKEEIEETIKNLITSHSKIEIVDLLSLPDEEWSKVEIIGITPTITGNAQFCIADIKFWTFSMGKIKNSADTEFFGTKLSYYGGGGMAVDNINSFKKTFFLQLEKLTKSFLNQWEVENK